MIERTMRYCAPGNTMLIMLDDRELLMFMKRMLEEIVSLGGTCSHDWEGWPKIAGMMREGGNLSFRL